MRLKLLSDQTIHEFTINKLDSITEVTINESSLKFELQNVENYSNLVNLEGKNTRSHAIRIGDLIFLHFQGRHYIFEDLSDQDLTAVGGSVAENVITPMPGSVIKVFVSPGDSIKQGQPLVIVEAMKMENEVKAPADVVIAKVNVTAGQQVGAGEILIEFEEPKQDESKPSD